MTIREALQFGAKKLRVHRCDGADGFRESEALLESATGTSRERMLARPESRISPAAARKFRSLVAARARHAPLAWLLGSAWFMGREFRSDRRALIPRPATERICEAAFDAAAARHPACTVDVGTGSGCVAATLALGLPDVPAFATDVSASALALAKSNARLLRAPVRFFRGDLLTPLLPRLRAADGPLLVVANLPYVPTARIAKLSACVRREPRVALDGGRDGLDPYRALLAQLPDDAALDLFCEIFPGQRRALTALARRRFPDAACAAITNGAVTVALHVHR